MGRARFAWLHGAIGDDGQRNIVVGNVRQVADRLVPTFDTYVAMMDQAPRAAYCAAMPSARRSFRHSAAQAEKIFQIGAIDVDFSRS